MYKNGKFMRKISKAAYTMGVVFLIAGMLMSFVTQPVMAQEGTPPVEPPPAEGQTQEQPPVQITDVPTDVAPEGPAAPEVVQEPTEVVPPVEPTCLDSEKVQQCADGSEAAEVTAEDGTVSVLCADGVAPELVCPNAEPPAAPPQEEPPVEETTEPVVVPTEEPAIEDTVAAPATDSTTPACLESEMVSTCADGSPAASDGTCVDLSTPTLVCPPGPATSDQNSALLPAADTRLPDTCKINHDPDIDSSCDVDAGTITWTISNTNDFAVTFKYKIDGGAEQTLSLDGNSDTTIETPITAVKVEGYFTKLNCEDSKTTVKESGCSAEHCSGASVSIDGNSFTYNVTFDNNPGVSWYNVTFCDGSGTGKIDVSGSPKPFTLTFDQPIESVEMHAGQCYFNATQECKPPEPSANANASCSKDNEVVITVNNTTSSGGSDITFTLNDSSVNLPDITLAPGESDTFNLGTGQHDGSVSWQEDGGIYTGSYSYDKNCSQPKPADFTVDGLCNVDGGIDWVITNTGDVTAQFTLEVDPGPAPSNVPTELAGGETFKFTTSGDKETTVTVTWNCTKFASSDGNPGSNCEPQTCSDSKTVGPCTQPEPADFTVDGLCNVDGGIDWVITNTGDITAKFTLDVNPGPGPSNVPTELAGGDTYEFTTSGDKETTVTVTWECTNKNGDYESPSSNCDPQTCSDSKTVGPCTTPLKDLTVDGTCDVETAQVDWEVCNPNDVPVAFTYSGVATGSGTAQPGCHALVSTDAGTLTINWGDNGSASKEVKSCAANFSGKPAINCSGASLTVTNNGNANGTYNWALLDLTDIKTVASGTGSAAANGGTDQKSYSPLVANHQYQFTLNGESVGDPVTLGTCDVFPTIEATCAQACFSVTNNTDTTISGGLIVTKNGEVIYTNGNFTLDGKKTSEQICVKDMNNLSSDNFKIVVTYNRETKVSAETNTGLICEGDLQVLGHDEPKCNAAGNGIVWKFHNTNAFPGDLIWTLDGVAQAPVSIGAGAEVQFETAPLGSHMVKVYLQTAFGNSPLLEVPANITSCGKKEEKKPPEELYVPVGKPQALIPVTGADLNAEAAAGMGLLQKLMMNFGLVFFGIAMLLDGYSRKLLRK